VTERLQTDAVIVGHPSFALDVPIAATSVYNRALLRYRTASPNLERVVTVLDFYPSAGVASVDDHSRYLDTVARLSVRHPETLFIVRPHPVQLRSSWAQTRRQYLRAFGESGNVFFHGSVNQPPLVLLLRVSDGVISTGGAGLIESSYLWVPTAIFQATPEYIEALYPEPYREHLTFCGVELDHLDHWVGGMERRTKVGDEAVLAAHAGCMGGFLARTESELL
jgi:hypothetical protein